MNALPQKDGVGQTLGNQSEDQMSAQTERLNSNFLEVWEDESTYCSTAVGVSCRFVTYRWKDKIVLSVCGGKR